MRVKYVYMRPTPVLYFGVTGAYEESAQRAWNTMRGWLDSNRVRLGPPRGFGLFQDEPASAEEHLCRYDACVEMRPGLAADPSNGIVRKVTPSGAYAIARLKGHHRQISDGFKRIRGLWSEADAIVVDPDRPYMEIYLSDPATTPAGELIAQLCVPVWLPIRVGRRRRPVTMIRA